MAGDYMIFQRRYQTLSTNKQVAATDSGTIHLIADALVFANHTLNVQKIEIAVLTDAAQTATFQDTSGVKIAVTKSSPGLGPIVFDFGPEGIAVTEAKGLDVVLSGAGLALAIHVEAYQRSSSTITGNTGTPLS